MGREENGEMNNDFRIMEREIDEHRNLKLELLCKCFIEKD